MDITKGGRNLLTVDVKRTAPDAANAKKQDSDVLSCVNAVVDGQISIKTIFSRGRMRVSVDFGNLVLIHFSQST